VTALEQLAALLPERWPTEGKGIHAEDFWAQAELDLALNLAGVTKRDPFKTGSFRAIQGGGAAGFPYVGSRNHKKSEATVEYLRNDDPKALLSFLGNEHKQGFMQDEQFARYIRFHARDACVALQHAKRMRHVRVMAECRLWLAWCLWWLTQAEWRGAIFTCGLRRQFSPEVLDFLLLQALRGETFNVKQRAMGFSPGSLMNGGMPRATDVWMALACREMGLLDDLEPVEPPLMFPAVFEKCHGSIVSYFPKLKGRPGGTDILAGVEMRAGWLEPMLHAVGAHDLPPAESWGYDPIERRLIAA
jgi:hypothetical protein